MGPDSEPQQMKSASKTLQGVAKRADEFAKLLDALSLVPVAEVAAEWRTTKEYVRRNVPIVKLGPKQHRVKLQDAVNFINKRTAYPVRDSSGNVVATVYPIQ